VIWKLKRRNGSNKRVVGSESKGKEKAHTRNGSIGGKSTGDRSGGRKSVDEWKPIVGNVVGEEHVKCTIC
jgi:hypothetical protein